MSQERYFIGPGLKDKLRDVIFRVNSAPHVTSGPHVPHVYSDIPPPIAKAKELRRGTFTGSWSIGGTNTVQVVGSSETVRVTNYCVPIQIEDGSEQQYNVIFGDIKGTQTAVEVQSPEVQADTGLRVGKISAAWDIGTCATVYVWKRTGTGENCVPVESDPLETVEDVVNLSHNVPADSWVVVGQASDGKWYLIESGKEVTPPDDPPTCQQTIGGEDITRWTGWDGTKVQLLGHDENGCLKWFDSEECEEESPGGA